MTMTETKELPVIDKQEHSVTTRSAGEWIVRRRGEWIQIVDAEGRERHRSRGHLLTATFYAGLLADQPFETTPNFESAMKKRAESFAMDDLPGMSATAQLPSSLTVREKICNCAGAVGQAKGFLQGVSTCEQLLPHQRGAAEQFAKELESRWDALSAELEQLLSQQSSPPQEPE